MNHDFLEASKQIQQIEDSIDEVKWRWDTALRFGDDMSPEENQRYADEVKTLMGERHRLIAERNRRLDEHQRAQARCY